MYGGNPGDIAAHNYEMSRKIFEVNLKLSKIQPIYDK
jgi:hypothetical protein